jgi:glycosyltransferase involved in cell wall biosynthesis
MPSVHVLLVGDALFGEDEAYARQLHRQCDALNLTNRVHFLGFRDDVPALMSLVDVIAHTSTAPEPFGRVIVEGMLAGTPVVATAAGGAREIINSGENGLLVPPADAAALRDALNQFLSAPDWAHHIADAARTTAQNRYSPEAMLSSITTHVANVHPTIP